VQPFQLHARQTGEFANVTTAQLLDHTSGLGDYFRPENRAAIEAAKTATDLLPLALAAPPALPPGPERAYSNSGFIVLGAVIEEVSGRSWAQFIQREILDRSAWPIPGSTLWAARRR
jgi:CubicO group peptidase (beta-lactamase class C family)